MLTNSAFATIIEANYVGTYGDTISFTADLRPFGVSANDGNPDTLTDMHSGQGYLQSGSVAGATATDPSNAIFSLAFVDPDYTVAFPGPGVYTIDLFEIIQGTHFQTNDDVFTPVVTDTRTITLAAAPVPEPSTWAMAVIGLMGIGIVRRRRHASR